MKIIHASNKIDQIGYQTENDRTQVLFDLSDIMQDFPGGMPSLVIRRPGEENATPVFSIEMNGTDLVWTVGAYEIEHKGTLKAQIIYTVSETIVKTKIYCFNVNESLLNIDPEPPEWQDWVSELLSAASGVYDDVQQAKQAADTATEKAAIAVRSADTAQSEAALATRRANDADQSAQRAETAVGQYNNMTAEANKLPAEADPTAEIDHSGDHPVLKIGIPGTESHPGTLDYEDLNNKPSIDGVTLSGDKTLHELGIAAESDIPAVPTKVSQLQNDSGYLTQETDPTVPNWAKQSTKPTYTAQEVGALPSDAFIPSKTSDLTNDSGFLTQETDPTVPSWAKEPTKPSYTAQEVGAYEKPAGGIPASDLAPGVVPDVSGLYTKPAGGIPATDLAAGVIPDVSGFYTKPANGIPATDLAAGVIPDVSGFYTKPAGGIPASDLAPGVVPDVQTKADKVQNATNNNFAALDANGNLKDSGHKHSDYTTAEIVSVSPTQPSDSGNKLWIKPDAEEEYTVPSYAEHQVLLNALTQSSENTSTAIFAHPVGDLFWYNGTLHIATSAIAIGDTIATTGAGKNCEETDINGEFAEIHNVLDAITDTEEIPGKNLFNPASLTDSSTGADWTRDGDQYYGTASKLATAYGTNGYPFNFTFKENTRYTLSMKCYTDNNASGSGAGLRIDFVYTDDLYNTYYVANTVNSWSSESWTSAAGKTIAKITLKWASKGANIWHFKEIQLEENPEATSYEAYGTTTTKVVVDTEAIPGFEALQESAGSATEILSAISETAYETGKNLFDPQYLIEASGWTESSGVYSGKLNNLLSLYGSSVAKYPIHAYFKENQRYTFSCKGYTQNEESGTGTGFMVQFKYTDGTDSKLGIANSASSFTSFSLTSASDKTISGVYFSYGAKPANVWYLKEIQLEEGTEVTTYAEYTETSSKAVKPTAIQDASIGRDKLSFNPSEGFITNAFPVQLFEIPYSESDMTYVGNELWIFGSSSDDHSTYAGLKRYTIDYDNGTYTYVTLFHNWGHVNAIDYSRGADALITSNAGQSTTDEGVIYIVQNASALKSLEDQAQVEFSTYVTQIDCSGLGLGYKFQLCWGESNNGRYDIVYLFTNEMEKLRRIQLGKGNNELSYGTIIPGASSDEFNGTFEILDEFDTNIHMQNNGIAYHKGHIYAVGDHTAKYILRFTPDVSGSVLIDRYKEVCRNPSGEISSPVVYGEGIAIHNGYMAFGNGTTIGIYEF